MRSPRDLGNLIAREGKRREVRELCDRLGYLSDLIAIEVKRGG